ncbi:MAG: YetF domain-containing protein [Clostridium sp.]|uniref:YetF domain-containing protein n=1 Tax=Clostridium sp. TaxID=1506 RepID=UPI003EE435B7
MIILLIRTIILYILVMIVMRLMGKRQVGELQPYEFIITIMVSDLALLPMQDIKLPLLLGIIPMLTLLLLKLSLSQLQLKSQFARKIIDGSPSILIYKSRIIYKELKNQQINIDELMEELRLAGYFDLEDIKYAILETNGDISILPNKSNDLIKPIFAKKNKGKYHRKHQPKTTMSGNEAPTEIFLPKILICDGKININALTKVNRSKDWIFEKLKENGITDLKKVLIAFFDTKGNFKYQLFDEYKDDEDYEK